MVVTLLEQFQDTLFAYTRHIWPELKLGGAVSANLDNAILQGWNFGAKIH
jgi:hypothetical protein